MSTTDKDLPVDGDGRLRFTDDLDIEIDLTEPEPSQEPGASESTDRGNGDGGPGRDDARVFAANVRFRPIVVALVLAGAVVAAYGAVATVALLRGEPPGSTILEVIDDPAPAVVAFAPEGATDLAACSQVEVFAFFDTNGNAAQGDAEDGQPGVRFSVRGSDGILLAEMETGPTGMARFDLPTPDVVAVEAIALPSGMWPGPRAAADAGAATLISAPTCSASLGFVWVPVDGVTPAIADPGTLPPFDGADVKTALLPGVDGGVQLHGRAWVDTDGDGYLAAAEPAMPGVTVVVRDEAGEIVAQVDTGDDGRYSFINLRPRRRYVVAMSEGSDRPVAARAATARVFDYPPDGIVIDTGDIGLSVWGVDFAYPSQAGTSVD